MLIAPVARSADTLYVDNTKSCPGGPGTSTSNAWCSIGNALNSISGGTNKVVAVMGTGNPYLEQVVVAATDSGTATQPLVLFARGAVTIEGSTGTTAWIARFASATSTTTLWSAKVADATACRQVVMNNRRYPDCDPDCLLPDIPVGKSQFDVASDTVYVNFDDPGNDYAGDTGYLCTRNPLEVNASNVVIDGFSVLRAKFDGIWINGDPNNDGTTRLRHATIRRCTVQHSGGQGIDITKGILCTVASNNCSNNTSHGIFVKSLGVDDCLIADNDCHANEDHSDATAGANGIRIGNFEGPTNGNHIVERNRTSLNQDTGIEVNKSDLNLLRQNQSWLNKDHGFDHIGASGTKHVGDLAYGNDRDGGPPPHAGSNSAAGAVR